MNNANQERRNEGRERKWSDRVQLIAHEWRPFSDSESELVLEPEPEDDESSSDSSEEEELALRRDWRWLAATDIPFPPFSPRDLGGLPPLSFPLTSWEGERCRQLPSRGRHSHL